MSTRFHTTRTLSLSAGGALLLLATGCGASAAKTAPAATAPTLAARTPTVQAHRDAAANAAQAACKLDSIYYAYDSNELDANARAALEQNAACLKRTAAARTVITGMTDPRGSEEYNLALGDRRARTAVHYIATLGVDEQRLDVRSVGEEYAAGDDETGWARDRRSDLTTQH